ncbi:hypothetical protein GCM10010218_47580 [Streptomyces mashuensis]|uniref:TPM domain-containing protein n=1 Tax=Streptomyces mashuensis TaxID=33904 RepID=A0A919B7K5_9ACTN|nr:TPM domain-containing protein [Streptomyces mashuensis]GHF60612.1 hypothetical protein GCM10010218_47580 [Streptomyces mashuensis]
MTRLWWRCGPGEASGRALAGALLALCSLLSVLFVLPDARADAPLDLSPTGRVTDTVGALGRRRGQVDASLEVLHSTHRVQLYVTYVRDFSGRAARTWADATADRNGLGPHDILLAIAVRGRLFAVSADKDSGFQAVQHQQIANVAIAPALRQHDWAGAAIGAADGYRAVLEGGTVRTPAIRPGSKDPGGDGLVPGERAVWVPLAGGSTVFVAGLYLWSKRARTAQRALVAAGGPPLVATGTEPGLARLAQPLTPLPELAAEAEAALVRTDDAVRTSAEELFFATAQAGEAATRPFAEAVGWARGELADAFRLRHRLDGADTADDDLRRHTLDEICSRCSSANRRLDAESAAFDRLRDLRAAAPDALARAEALARALAPRLATAEAALAALAPGHPEAALAPVAGHPDGIRDRLAFAGAALTEARAALSATDRRGAVLSLRAAESALHQARMLISGVLRHAYGLTAAAARLRAVLAAAGDDPAADEARRLMAKGPYDPREVLRELDAAAPGRPGRWNRTVLAAYGEVAAARDAVTTQRGATGCRARTHLAEAERHLTQGAPDRARTLALQSRALADHDTDGFIRPDDMPPPVATAVLAGIVLPPDLAPACFGGVRTRGRLGG